MTRSYRHNIFIIQQACLMDYALHLYMPRKRFFFFFFSVSRRTDSVCLASLELEESLIVLERCI